MPRELKDADGNVVQVPDEAEIEALKAKAAKLDELGENPGIKSVREALDRKETLLAQALKDKTDLEAKIAAAAAGGNATVVEDETKKMEMLDKVVQKRLVNVELTRALATLPDEAKDAVKKTFEKLTSGEDVTEETVQVYLQQALSANNLAPKEHRRTASQGGRPARTTEKAGSFADTPDGKAWANHFGFQTEAPKQEKK